MDILSALLTQYKDDAYMMMKLTAYMTNLPTVMANIESSRKRKHGIAQEIDEVSGRLIVGLYYLHGRFVHVQDTCVVLSKDDVLHEVHRRMPAQLPTSKHHLAQMVLAKIKRASLYETYPSKEMQRAVLRGLYPAIFETKTIAKYFLTIVGDLLLNQKGLIYFVKADFKAFLTEFERQLHDVTRATLDCFKHKYHEHAYIKCRLFPGAFQGGAFTGNMLDCVCVAAWYSRKHGGDKTALKMPQAATIFMLKNNTPLTLVKQFLNTYTVPSVGKTVPFKNMYYLWCHFLRRMCLPSVIARHNLKHILRGEGLLEEDTCINVAVLGHAGIFNFEQFWDHFIFEAENSEFTLGEIVAVYNNWCDNKPLYLSEDDVATWLARHQAPDVLKNIGCTMWDKASGIENALEAFKYDPVFSTDPVKMYNFYRSYTERVSKFVVTFDYFLKYVTANAQSLFSN
jgi:hypothetical protein